MQNYTERNWIIMPQYTDRLEQKQYNISPTDDDYIDELTAVTGMFRTFGEALTAFLAEHNFTSFQSLEATEQYIRDAFENATIPVPRSLPRWFSEGIRPSRRTAFQICFALGLDFDSTQDFFRRVLLQRGIDCHDQIEAVYYFALRHGISYCEVLVFLKDIPNFPTGAAVQYDPTIFTIDIISKIDLLETQEDLAVFLKENAGWFKENNRTASRFIQQLWDEIAAKDGLAERERFLVGTEPTAKNHSIWDTYLQILGLPTAEIQAASLDWSLKFMLKNDRLLHSLAQDCFPDRQGLQLILAGKHVAYERVRKLLILLSFYSFWANRAISKSENICRARGGDADRCLAEIDRFLADSSYPALYAGNPYDWLFLFAMQDDYPLETFRGFMGELFAQGVERNG